MREDENVVQAGYVLVPAACAPPIPFVVGLLVGLVALRAGGWRLDSTSLARLLVA